MNERSKFDDRPPIDVSRFHPSVGEVIESNDRALGWLEISVTHVRNAYRDLVASDDLSANDAAVAEITAMFGPIVEIAQALQGTFIAFDAEIKARG